MKRCNKCGIEKEITLFSRNKSKRDGFSGWCKECNKEYQKKYKGCVNKNEREIYKREYYLMHKNKILGRRKQRYIENREKSLEQSKEYQRLNFKKTSISKLKWAKLNPEKNRLCRKISQARRRLKTGIFKVTLEEINKLIQDSDNKCFWCDCNIPEGMLHLDHIYPLSKNGDHTITNLVVSCSSCNQHKHAKDPEIWLEEILSKKEDIKLTS